MKNISSVWTRWNKYIISVISLIVLLGCGYGTRCYFKDIKERRAHHMADLTGHERAPLIKEEVKKVKHFRIDNRYRMKASLFYPKERIEIELGTYSGMIKHYTIFATAHFKLRGQKKTLDIFRSEKLSKIPMYKNHLFLPFKDLTNGDLSYGGGRYLDLTTDDVLRDSLIIDFNLAYNPWCAYSEGYNCPIPPNQNILDIAIEAGEMNFKKEHNK